MDRRYYEEEMRYLHEAGRAFARAHPEQAPLLGAGAAADRDPFVERLLEGFALLAGRVHQRLDDEMPHYTEGLLRLLYPQLLQPVPALAVAAFPPEPGLVQETTLLPRGTEVRTGPVGAERVPCRFVTAHDVQLHPVRLREVALQWPSDEASAVRLRFALERGVDYRALRLSPLRLYFDAAPATASAMHLFLTRHVRRVRLSAGDERVVLDGGRWVRPAGFAPTEALLPDEPSVFSGYRLLQEYLCFRRRFWFVDLYGLDRLAGAGPDGTFEVELGLDRAYPQSLRFGTEHVRLYCTPIVNRFVTDAEPIRAEGYASTYRVRPSARYPSSVEAHEVEAVAGTEDGTGRRVAYEPYPAARALGPAFTATRRLDVDGRSVLDLRLAEADTAARPQTLSVRVTATNGPVPHQHVPAGTRLVPGPGVPRLARPACLTRPTLPADPRAQAADRYRDLVAHLSYTIGSVATREAMVGLMEVYDWTGSEANRRRRAGIRGVRTAPCEVVEGGAALRGVEVTVEVEHGHFADEGDLCLFGHVMSVFLKRYVTLNAFVRFTLELLPTRRTYTWPPSPGTRTLL